MNESLAFFVLVMGVEGCVWRVIGAGDDRHFWLSHE